jgi:hypothetical protein
LKLCKARSLGDGTDKLGYDENSLNLRYATLWISGFMRFLYIEAPLGATLTILVTNGALAFDRWDKSRSGQETPNLLPHLGSACYPLEVASKY